MEWKILIVSVELLQFVDGHTQACDKVLEHT